MAGQEWPQEIVDAINRIGVDNPANCGDNKAGYKGVGCGEPLVDPNDRYKCVDCDVVFHRHCARKHFADSRDSLQAKLGVYERQHEILTGALRSLKERIRALHDMVKQTDPDDPIGVALTKVGLERRP